MPLSTILLSHSSDNSGRMTGDKAVKAHLAAGVPADKLVMGMPFLWPRWKGISQFSRLQQGGICQRDSVNVGTRRPWTLPGE